MVAGREAGEEEYRDGSGKMIQENGDESGQTIQEGGNANEGIKEGMNGGLDESSLSEQTESGQLHEERAHRMTISWHPEFSTPEIPALY